MTDIITSPKSVYIAFASATSIALADLSINGNIESTKLFWEIALAYAVARQAIKSFSKGKI